MPRLRNMSGNLMQDFYPFFLDSIPIKYLGDAHFVLGASDEIQMGSLSMRSFRLTPE